MQLFYAPDLDPASGSYLLGEEESKHAVRVLRLGRGDSLWVTDGRGAMCRAEIADDSPRGCRLEILGCEQGFGQRHYSLHLAVAPTKNVDRYEWFAEKATEIGVDRITPVLTDRCERRTLRIDRILRVVTGAMKQSLKAYLPRVDSPMPLRELLELPCAGSRLIAHCEESGNRTPLGEAFGPREQVLILIGPEGDFSSDEIRSALDSGFRAVSLGRSRLRTETAGVVAAHSVAFVNGW